MTTTVTATGLNRDLCPNPVETLEQGLGGVAGRPIRIVAAEAEPLDTFSTHPIFRLRATLASGPTLTTIFKRLRPGLEEDVHREREVRIYRRVLAGRRFGAPMLYASLDDDARGNYWLFLEDAGDWVLDYCEAETWETAFRWLARLHAAYQGREDDLAILGCLGEHGPGFYRNLARAARLSLRRAGQPEQLARFDDVIERCFDNTVASLARLPRTLIHGDMSGHNLIVQPDGRIRPIDWEWAAIGLPAWDVTRLVSGWAAPERERFVTVYLDERDRLSGLSADRIAFARTLTHCGILRSLWYLRWWTRRCEEPGYVDGLLAGMETRCGRIEREGAGD